MSLEKKRCICMRNCNDKTFDLQIPVRPFRHNEYERFITAAFPYYGASFSMVHYFSSLCYVLRNPSQPTYCSQKKDWNPFFPFREQEVTPVSSFSKNKQEKRKGIRSHPLCCLVVVKNYVALNIQHVNLVYSKKKHAFGELSIQ